MRRVLFAALAACALAGAVASANGAPTGPGREYVVLYKHGASGKDARAAIAAAGGRIVSENADIGVATVRSTDERVRGRRRSAERARRRRHRTRRSARPRRTPSAKRDAIEKPGDGQCRASAPTAQGATSPRQGDADPLADLQWDMQQIGATADGSYKTPAGLARRPRRHHRHRRRRRRTRTSRRTSTRAVAATSPSTTRSIDGPCDTDPDQSCNDPANVDEDGHGTHVAGTIGAAAQRHRHRRRRAEGRHRQPPRRPGLGLLLPRPDARRAHLRRRQRHRRREHALLHRSVAVQLHGQPGRLAGRAARAAARSSRRRSGRSTTPAATA